MSLLKNEEAELYLPGAHAEDEYGDASAYPASMQVAGRANPIIGVLALIYETRKNLVCRPDALFTIGHVSTCYVDSSVDSK